jgi:hypothetical protein
MKRPHVEITASNAKQEASSPLKPTGQLQQAQNDLLKWVALLVLVLQNSGLILFMRMSRVMAPAEKAYCISTAVATSEAIKLVISSVLLFLIDSGCSGPQFWSILRSDFRDNWRYSKCFAEIFQNNCLQFIQRIP